MDSLARMHVIKLRTGLAHGPAQADDWAELVTVVFSCCGGHAVAPFHSCVTGRQGLIQPRGPHGDHTS